jgi:hypothetical protein
MIEELLYNIGVVTRMTGVPIPILYAQFSAGWKPPASTHGSPAG